MADIEQQSLFPEPAPEPSAELPYSGDAYEGDLHPPYHESHEPLTPQEKAIGRAGVSAARIELEKVRIN